MAAVRRGDEGERAMHERFNAKFPGAVEAHAGRLREEGHTIASGKGKNAPRVDDFEKKLVTF